MTALEIILIILMVLFLGAVIAWQVVKRVRKAKGKSTKSSCGCGCDCGGCAVKNCPSKSAQKYYGDDEAMPEVNVQSDVTCDFSDLIAKK